MLAGFEQPTAGRIFVGAEDITHVAVEKRGIGMVFQNYALFPNMTVGENIGFPLRVRRLPPPRSPPRSSARWRWCGWRDWPIASRSSCPAASSRGWRWRARWCSSPGWCCSTSRWARSTGSYASRCSMS
jgi:ABC-type sugar transport system ATPase subunit